MNIVDCPIEDVIPYARNPRKNAAAIAAVAASIREFGFRQPIVVAPDMTVVVGHTRLEAARALGLATVPVHVAEGLTEAQTKAYRLADNRTGENAEWDEDLLALELADLDGDIDLSLTGFTEEELAALGAIGGSAGLTDPDATPDVPEHPVSAIGDLWLLGDGGAIICGDCTDATVVARVLGDIKPHLMVTDPPYGVEYDADWRNRAIRTDGSPFGGRAVGAVLNDDKADWSEAWALFPGEVAYVWHAGVHASAVQLSLEACGFNIRSQVIWAKPRFSISRGHYHWQHEPCWYAVRKGGKSYWSSDRSQSTLWSIPHNKSETGHSTQKPVECMKRPIENNSSPGQAVYEPFSGSGTTIIAAAMIGRVCYACELNPAYVDVAVTRWKNFTGQEAVLEGDGRTFNAIAEARAAA